MNLPVTYIWTHDSIGLGEDGPTHQPVEHIAALRAIPNLDVIRPADANEVAVAWQEVIRRRKPAALLLSRQNLPVIDRSKFNSAAGVKKGAYAINDVAKPDLIIFATGSELSLALAAAAKLEAQDIKARVISASCIEWFKEEPDSYREQLIPANVRARVSIEAGIAQGWREFVGDLGEIISLEHFGASASHTKLFEEFGFTVENVIAASLRTLAKVK